MSVSEQSDNFLKPFEALKGYLDEIDVVLRLSVAGISELTQIDEMVHEVIQTQKKYPKLFSLPLENPEQKLVEAQRTANLAKNEQKKGFPLLVRHSIVALWSALETAIPDFVIRIIHVKPQVLQKMPLSKIKLPVGIYSGLSVDDFYSHVINEYERDTSGILKSGIGRFENLLNSVGLGGEVDEEVRRNLFELSKVRNLIVHNFCVVDRRFLSDCPWVNSSVGKHLALSFDAYRRFAKAIHAYSANILRRTLHDAEIPFSESSAKTSAAYSEVNRLPSAEV